MSPRRIAAGRGRLARALVALAAASACFAAVAYAANRPASVAPRKGAEATRETRRLPVAQLLEYPAVATIVATAQFRFNVPPWPRPSRPAVAGAPPAPATPRPPRRFQCRLESEDWRPCSSPEQLTGLAPGGHWFSVRALGRRSGRPGPAVSYGWQRLRPPAPEPRSEPVDPRPFSIEARGELEPLLPGDPPQPLAVTIVNPNSVSIEVTGLTASLSGEPESCPAENFALTPSSASPGAPLQVPAGGSVDLPSATVTAPAIAMLNLPQNQDACRGAAIHLDFRGEARG